jgi:hypothetical protein
MPPTFALARCRPSRALPSDRRASRAADEPGRRRPAERRAPEPHAPGELRPLESFPSQPRRGAGTRRVGRACSTPRPMADRLRGPARRARALGPLDPATGRGHGRSCAHARQPAEPHRADRAARGRRMRLAASRLGWPPASSGRRQRGGAASGRCRARPHFAPSNGPSSSTSSSRARPRNKLTPGERAHWPRCCASRARGRAASRRRAPRRAPLAASSTSTLGRNLARGAPLRPVR